MTLYILNLDEALKFIQYGNHFALSVMFSTYFD